ncbi:hypothetical protein GTA08_BOTSDO13493 [Neofusicoccum parvum]|nr:hypothetical protein GTA08_BOTSDO13493 [Neofusicoccum parvum]
MRKLADYAFMLRDFRLAASTYDILRTDFNNDKAWKYYAGANEMTVISTLLVPQKRISDCYTGMQGVGHLSWGTRKRKAGLWAVLSADSWMKLDKSVQAEKCLDVAASLYGMNEDADATDEKEEHTRRTVEFSGMRGFMDELRQAVVASRLASRVGFGAEEGAEGDDGDVPEGAEAEAEEIVEEVSETLGQDKRSHRKSLIGAVVPPLAGENSMSPMRTRDENPAFLTEQQDKPKELAVVQEGFETAEGGEGAGAGEKTATEEPVPDAENGKAPPAEDASAEAETEEKSGEQQ